MKSKLIFYKEIDGKLIPVYVNAQNVVMVCPINAHESTIYLSSGATLEVSVDSETVSQMLHYVTYKPYESITAYDLKTINVHYKYSQEKSELDIINFTRFYVKGDKIYLFKSGYHYTTENNSVIYMWLKHSSAIEESEPQMP